jgi:hypothetical protein
MVRSKRCVLLGPNNRGLFLPNPHRCVFVTNPHRPRQKSRILRPRSQWPPSPPGRVALVPVAVGGLTLQLLTAVAPPSGCHFGLPSLFLIHVLFALTVVVLHLLHLLYI